MFEKIISIYSELSFTDFSPNGGTIQIQNDSDGKGDYIAKWEHPTLTRPTQTQLDEVTE
jgi:hypothetical protein